jgi:pimeloyl-ACP methyl ester carboxylesterase
MTATNQQDWQLPLDDGETLYIRRIWQDAAGPPVLLIHGVMANGRIFYTDSGKGWRIFGGRRL